MDNPTLIISYAEILKTPSTNPQPKVGAGVETKTDNTWTKVSTNPYSKRHTKKQASNKKEVYLKLLGRFRKFGKPNTLNCCFPLHFDKLTIENLLFSLVGYKKPQKILKKILHNKLPQFKNSTIYNKGTMNQYFDQQIRLSQKATYREKTPAYQYLERELFPQIRQQIQAMSVSTHIMNLKFGNHCDILFYPGGGFFEPHRDDVNTPHMQEAIKEGYDVFSLVFGLSEDYKNIQSGTTTIWTRYNGYTQSANKTYQRHAWATGSRQGCGVLFPSTLLHSGGKCYRPTLKFKIDVYLKFKMTYSNYCFHTKKNPCDTCLLCNEVGKNKQRHHKVFYCKNFLPKTITLHIASFLGFLKPCHCIDKIESCVNPRASTRRCNYSCNCGCTKCAYNYNHNYCTCRSCKQAREEYEEQDRYCNGHDY